MNIPLSLYVHLPWCVRKCPYCDFNSHALRDALPEQDYLAALLRDLEHSLAQLESTTPLVSVFFGGGTPSLFSAASFATLLDTAERCIGFAPDIEITLEANPGTIEHGRFADYRAAGINRISLGAQTFDNRLLQLLGRIHDADAIRLAAEELQQAGIDNFNLDLMTVLPEQTVDMALADVEQALQLSPMHISLYELTLEPNTLFAVRPPAGIPDEDAAIEILAATRERLASAGFDRYEISAFAREQKHGRHNLNYWQFGDYLGIGAGAHGKHTDAGGEVTRTGKPKHPTDYMKSAGHAAAQITRTDAATRIFEYMLNRMRLVSPASWTEFEQRTGAKRAQVATRIRHARELGLLTFDDHAWQMTERGLDLLNDAQALFLPGR